MPTKDEIDDMRIEKLLLDFNDYDMLETVRDHLRKLQKEKKHTSAANQMAIFHIGEAIRFMENRPQEDLRRS